MKERLFKQNRNILLVIVMVLLASFLFLFFINRKADLSSNVERRAFYELQTANLNHQVYVNKLVEKEYVALHTLSTYFGSKDDFDFRNELELANSVVLSNHFCSMGYADLNGNAINFKGESVGNISEDPFFIAATSWMGEDAIEFKLTTMSVDEPRILLASPVRHKNVMTGILYASMEIPDFNDKLFSYNFDGSEIVFVTDATGNIIMANMNAEDHLVGTNLFETHSDSNLQDSSMAEIISNMEKGKGGQFKVFHNELEYVVYNPLGIADWTVFSMVPASVANSQYSSNKSLVESIVRLFTIAFLVSVAVVCGLILLTIWISERSRQKIRMQDDKYHMLLGSIQSAVFEYDVDSQIFNTSKVFEEIMGYPLPKNSFAQISTLSTQHPEFDFETLQEKIISVTMSGKEDDVYLPAKSETKGMVWLHITMVPLSDGKGRVKNVLGVISDVTDHYNEKLQLMQDKESALTIITATAVFAVSANLTRNTCHVFSCSDLFADGMDTNDGDTSYDDLIQQRALSTPEDDRDAFLSMFSRENLLRMFVQGKKQVSLLHRFAGKDKDQHWIMSRGIMLNDKTGQDVYLTIVATDMTKYKRREEFFQRKYKIAIDNMPAYAIEWIFKDGDIYNLAANEKFLSFLGISQEEVVSRSITYGLNDGEKQEILGKLYFQASQKKDIVINFHMVTKLGEEKLVHVQATYLEDQDENPVYFGVLTDVTNVALAEKKTRQAEAVQHTDIGQFDHTILEYDLLTHQMRLISGGDSRINIADAISDFPTSAIESGVISGDSLDDMRKMLDQINSGENSDTFSLSLLCEDGTQIMVNASGTIVHNPIGAPSTAVIILEKTGEKASDSLTPEGRNARPSIQTTEKHISVRTFGAFDLFVDGKPVYFTNAKAKELLAILIDRKGGTLTSEEAIGILWEDEPAGEKQLARYRKMASRLKEILDHAGCGEILTTSNGIRSIDTSKFDCDYYRALEDDEAAKKMYQGVYMSNYSWADSRTVILNQIFGFDDPQSDI